MRAHGFGAIPLGLLLFSACSSTNNGTPDGGASADSGAPDGAAADGGSDAASSGALGFTPSNFDPTLLDLTGLGDVDCTAPGGGITTSQNPLLTCGDQSKAKFTILMQPNNLMVGVWVARSWRIEPNAVLGVSGINQGAPFPLILVATQTIDILGGLSATASTNNTVAGGFTGSPNSNAGGGPGAGSVTPQANYPAGGGGSYCGVGGNGVILDNMGASTTAAGGTSYGTPEIVPLVGGSTGGGGGLFSGAGGGAIQLVAGTSISIEASGSVNVGGGGGGAGGGGGSGGSLLLEAPTVTVAGAIAANGGGGASCGTGPSGGNGLASNQPAPGGATTNGGCVGGNGGAGATMNGTAAQPTMTSNEGGGGGGAGRIRINTKSGSATLTGGTVSPGATTTCMTQGMLH
jgi:hypothetical protein